MVSSERALEWVAGLAVAALIGWLGVTGWRAYDEHLLPHARAIPTETPTPQVDPEVAKQQARLIRRAIDHVGAGNSYRQGNRPDLAVVEYLQALAFDPANSEARQNLRELGVEPPPGDERTPVPPTSTPPPTVTPRP